MYTTVSVEMWNKFCKEFEYVFDEPFEPHISVQDKEISAFNFVLDLPLKFNPP